METDNLHPDKSNLQQEEDEKVNVLQHGPLSERSCTDIFCCLIFLIFLLGMSACSYAAFQHGDPKRIPRPFQGNDNLCGSNGDDFKFMYWPRPIMEFYNYTICVNRCPTEKDVTLNYTKNFQSSGSHVLDESHYLIYPTHTGFKLPIFP